MQWESEEKHESILKVTNFAESDSHRENEAKIVERGNDKSGLRAGTVEWDVFCVSRDGKNMVSGGWSEQHIIMN